MESTEVLKQFVSDELLNGYSDIELHEDDNLLGDGMVDSLGMMRLLEFIAEHFSVRVPPEDLTIENFQNIRVIAAYLSRQKA